MEWEMVWAILGGMLGMLTVYSGLMIWFVNRMESRLDAHISATNDHFDAVNSRLDQTIHAMGARIDTTQAIIMRMLEKK